MLYSVSGILLGIVVLLWIRWRRNKFTIFKELGIPGPEPSIFFGNVREMVEKNPIACQNNWIQKFGGVLGYYYGTWPTLLVSDPEILKQVLIKDFSSFSDRPTDFFAAEGDRPNHPSSQHMINQKGKKWKEARSLMTPAFTTGKLKQMMPLLKDSVNLMVSKLEKASGNGTKDVEIYDLYKGMTMDAIGRTALGMDSSVQEKPNHPLLRLVKLLLAVNFQSMLNVLFVSFREFDFLLQPFRLFMFMLYNKGSNPLDELFSMLKRVVRMRKEDPSSRRPDLMQTMIDARVNSEDIALSSLTASAETVNTDTERVDNKNDHRTKTEIKLTDAEVEANAFLVFLAGYETTSTTMAFLSHHLLNNLDVQDKMREEIIGLFGKDGPLEYELLMKMNYSERVIMEALRLNPPVFAFTNRVANRDVQLGKWKIPAGMTVQVPIHNIHYNSENFDDPHSFNPDRFLPENRGPNYSVTWIPFGAGPRNCVGMRFALLEIKMALATMLRKFKLEPCGKTEIGNVENHFNFAIVSPRNGIYARAVPI